MTIAAKPQKELVKPLKPSLGLPLSALRNIIEFAFCRVNHWQKPQVANEAQALIALFRSLFDLYPLKALR